MRKINYLKVSFIVVFLISMCSCNEDPCDVAHTMINGECIPDYIFPQNENLKSGDKFYHTKYGVIIFKNGNWYNDKGKFILELNTKKH
jgi:hypothetical protein